MRQMTLTQSGAPGRVIGWTNVSHKHSTHGFRISLLLFIFLILVGDELPLCIVVTLSWNAITCFLESS